MKHDLIVLAGWLLATAIVNALLRVRTVAEWEALAETNPRFLALARLLRSIGLDPVKLIESVVDLVRGETRRRLGPVATSQPDTKLTSDPEPIAALSEAAQQPEEPAPSAAEPQIPHAAEPEPAAPTPKARPKKKRSSKKRG